MRKTALALLLVSVMLLSVVPVIVHQTSGNPLPPPPTSFAYIGKDGDVEPSTLPIKREGNVYTFTSEVYNYTLEVQCDNVVIDGAGYDLWGVGSYTGITLSDRRNVTIKNMSINQFGYCISISQSSNITIMENEMSSFGGVVLYSSDNNQIIRNSLNNGVSGLTSFSNIIGNNFTGTGYVEIGGDNNTISENLFRGDTTSIGLYGAYGSKHNTISNNTVETGEGDGIYLFPNSIFNTVCGNKVTGKSGCGIKIDCSHNNTVYDNYLAGNGVGIYIGNPAFQNAQFPRSQYNTLYHNNLTGNVENVHIERTFQGNTFLNLWDDGKEGNYWSDYNGTDGNRDGVGDAPYVITWNNVDYFPLCTRAPFPTVFVLVASVVSVIAVCAGLLVYLKKRHH